MFGLLIIFLVPMAEKDFDLTICYGVIAQTPFYNWLRTKFSQQMK